MGPGLAERDGPPDKEEGEVASEMDLKMSLCFLLSNVQSQENMMDEIQLGPTQEIRDCCAHIFTET